MLPLLRYVHRNYIMPIPPDLPPSKTWKLKFHRAVASTNALSMCKKTRKSFNFDWLCRFERAHSK